MGGVNVPRIGRAELRGLLAYDLLRWIAGAQLIHDLAHVGRAGRPIPPHLGRGAAREHSVQFRPLRDGQVRVGPGPVAPGAQDLARAVEVLVICRFTF